MCVAGLRGVPVETVTCSSASAENFKKNRIKGRLKKMLPVSLMITPSVAWIKVDDHYLAYEQNLTLENHNKREKHSTRLSEGKHTLEVGHSQAEQSKKFDIDLIDYGLAIQKTVQLIPKQSYINQLEREKQHQAQNEQYESDMSSWHWNLGLSLVGSGIVALYAYQENQNAQAASDNQKDYESAILSSSTSTEGATNRDKAMTENDNVKQHNQNAQIGGLISMGMLGFATWIWLNDPEESKQISWQPNIMSNGNMQMSFNINF